MKVTAKQYFKANGVKAYPGLILSQEQLDQIGTLLSDLKLQSLVEVEDHQPAPEPPAEFEGIIDEGPEADEAFVNEKEPEKQPKKKKK